MQYALSTLIWLPIASGFFMLFMGDDKNPQTVRVLSLFTILLTMGISVLLFHGFDINSSEMQFEETLRWMPTLGISYHLGIDGLSLLLIALSIFTNLIILLATWDSIKMRVAQYLAALMFLQGFLVGVFSSLDSILFYVFWEATLIPMYLIIGIWGSSNRVYAAIKFFLYTFLGSVLMLAAFIYLGFQAGSFELSTFNALKLPMSAQTLIFIAFFFGFAIKIPMFPVHTWLPDAHTEAPAGGSILLAAILLKLGAYGFIRLTLPIVPDASKAYAGIMVALSLIAIVYIGFIAIVQKDMKKLIAYSSISHMGFVTLGCFGIYSIAARAGIEHAGILLEGAMIVIISHAFISSGMFAGVGYLYDRLHTRMLDDFGGVVHSMPIFATFFMLFSMANAGLPGTSGFVGEFMIILGSMNMGFWVPFWASLTLILGAAYTLWMYKRVIFGPAKNKQIEKLKDLTSYECTAYALLAFMVLFMGIYPNFFLDYLHPVTNHVLLEAIKTKIA